MATLDNLKKNKKYSFIGNKSGSSIITFDATNYEEIFVIVCYKNALNLSITIPIIALSDATKTFNIGGYYTHIQGDNVRSLQVNVNLSKKQCSIASAIINNENNINDCEISLYAK